MIKKVRLRRKKMNTEFFEKLKELIAREWGVDQSEITPSSHLQEDLNADPLSISDLMIKIEEGFQIKIPENQTTNFKTVSDLLDFISEQTGEI